MKFAFNIIDLMAVTLVVAIHLVARLNAQLLEWFFYIPSLVAFAGTIVLAREDRAKSILTAATIGAAVSFASSVPLMIEAAIHLERMGYWNWSNDWVSALFIVSMETVMGVGTGVAAAAIRNSFTGSEFSYLVKASREPTPNSDV